MIDAYTQLIERPIDRVQRSCISKTAFASRREARSRVNHGRHRTGRFAPITAGSATPGIWAIDDADFDGPTRPDVACDRQHQERAL
jgi:hypothetical protein